MKKLLEFQNKVRASLSKDWYLKYFIIFLLLFFISNIVWISLDTSPLHWDPAEHTRIAFDFHAWLIGQNSTSLLEISNFYAPITHFFSGFLMLFTGKNADTPAIMMTFMAMLTAIVLRDYLYKTFGSQFAANLAPILFLLLPNTIQFSKLFWLEIPTVFWLVLILRTSHKLAITSNRQKLFMALSISGLLLTRINAFTYLISLILSIIYVEQLYKYRKTLINLLAIVFIGFLMAAPWYITNIAKILELSAVFANFESYEPDSVFTIKNLIYNLFIIVNQQLNWVGLLLLGIGSYFSYKLKPKLTIFSLINIGAIYLIYTIILNKDLKYLFPISLFLSIAAAYGYQYLLEQRKAVTTILVSLYIIFFSIHNLVYGFGIWIDPKLGFTELKIQLPWYREDDVLNNIIVYYVGYYGYWINPAYDDREWPQKQIIDRLSAQCSENKKTLLLAGKVNFNIINFEYLKRELAAECVDITYPYGLRTTDLFSKHEYLDQFDYFIVPASQVGPVHLNELTALEDLRSTVFELEEDGLITEIRSYSLPQVEYNSSEPSSILLFEKLTNLF